MIPLTIVALLTGPLIPATAERPIPHQKKIEYYKKKAKDYMTRLRDLPCRQKPRDAGREADRRKQEELRREIRRLQSHQGPAGGQTGSKETGKQ